MGFGRRTILGTVLALACAAGGLASWRTWRDAGPDPTAELLRLVPGHRPLLARLSISLPGAPFDPAAPLVGPEQRDAIYARLLAAKVAGAPGAGTALAAFYAARREPGDEERALAEAVDPVDRGAVLLALDRADEALEEFSKALAQRPADPAAHFDRALAREALLLDGQAAAGWEAFLEVEGSGFYADEARARLASSRAPHRPADLPPELRKRRVILALFDLRNREDLEGSRADAEEVARLGDSLALRSIEYLEGLDEDGWKAHVAELVSFAAARKEIEAGREASTWLRRLEGSRDPVLAVKSTSFAAYSALLRGEAAEAREALGRLRQRCRSLGCTEEPALAISDLGNLRQAAGDPAGALRAYAEAERSLPPSFTLRRGELLVKQATAARALGEFETASRRIDGAIRIQHDLRLPELVYSLSFRAELLAGMGRGAAAEEVAREALNLGRDAAPWTEVRATERLASILADAGRYQEAIELLRSALLRLEATDLRPRRLACLRQLARIHLDAGDLAAADRTTQEALAASDARDPALLETMARIARARGEGDRAIELLRRAVASDREMSTRVGDVLRARRVESGTAERRLLLASTLGERGEAAQALEVFSGRRDPGLVDGECRIGFAAVEGRLVSFSTSVEGPRFDTRPLSREEARLLIVEAWAGDRAAAARHLGSPWDRDRCPTSAGRLSILEPPGAIGAPVAVLATLHRPDAEVAIALSPTARWPGSFTGQRALALVSPESDEELPPLPSGDSEARSIERRWRTTWLQGPLATPGELAAQVPGAQLVHLGVHGVSRTGNGGASYLILSGPEGRLAVPDVLGLPLRASRPLVTLSACRAAMAIENVEKDGGGLPWAFLHAGARAVVAPVGPVEDHVAAAFSEAYYAELAAGTPLALAVKRANAMKPAGARTDFVLYF